QTAARPFEIIVTPLCKRARCGLRTTRPSNWLGLFLSVTTSGDVSPIINAMNETPHEAGRAMPSHARALQSFSRKLAALLLFRESLRWATAWFFVWGVVVIAARISGVPNQTWMLLGMFGAVLPMAAASALEWRRLPKFAGVRATYDHLNECGGMLMAEEAADM